MLKIKKLELPLRFQNVNYDTDILQAMKDIVEKIKVTNKGLYLFGPPGTGKTHAAYAICKKIEAEGKDVRAFKIIDILQMIRDDMNFKDRKETFGDIYFEDNNIRDITFLEGINKYNGLLFLDDLGVQKGTDWEAQIIYSIIDNRYEKMLPTIITSNFNLEELKNERIASRISQMCEVIATPGKDRRLSDNNSNIPHEKS